MWWRSRGFAGVSLLVLAVFLAVPAQAQELIPATVTSVVDGDTIKVLLTGGQVVTVRLTGIDTPETKHPTKPVQCFGAEASARTAELLPVNTVVSLERDVQEFDRYGRTLAYVWSADGTTMINEQLVAEGYALTLTIPPNVKYAERFTAAAQTARDGGLGLWSACAGTPLEATDDAPMMDETVPVSQPAAAPAAQPQPAGNCDPSYPDFCIPPAPPDLNCTSAAIGGRKNFTVLPPDPHHFDADKDGIGCESRR